MRPQLVSRMLRHASANLAPPPPPPSPHTHTYRHIRTCNHDIMYVLDKLLCLKSTRGLKKKKKDIRSSLFYRGGTSEKRDGSRRENTFIKVKMAGMRKKKKKKDKRKASVHTERSVSDGSESELSEQSSCLVVV